MKPMLTLKITLLTSAVTGIRCAGKKPMPCVPWRNLALNSYPVMRLT